MLELKQPLVEASVAYSQGARNIPTLQSALDRFRAIRDSPACARYLENLEKLSTVAAGVQKTYESDTYVQITFNLLDMGDKLRTISRQKQLSHPHLLQYIATMALLPEVISDDVRANDAFLGALFI